MSGRRTGTPNTPSPAFADGRIPFPCTDEMLACRRAPKLFAIEDTDRAEQEKALVQARLACSSCPPRAASSGRWPTSS